MAGVVLYWGEGSKTSNRLELANSDIRLVQVFLRWLDTLGVDRKVDLGVQLFLHGGQDAEQLKRWWSSETGIPIGCFIKPFVKPEGTGHRTNHLYRGTVRIYVRRSSHLFHTVMGWIDGVAALPTMSPGR
ncbi:MAG: hypothetical protein M3N51_08840 [Actinomycetota bacterium]|nr:hypothetical protein [Actinomycetota bacterium]